MVRRKSAEPVAETEEAEPQSRRRLRGNGDEESQGRRERAETRRPRDDDNDEETPRGSRRRRPSEDDDRDTEETKFHKPSVRGGWDRGEERKKQFGSEFPDEWRVEPVERLAILLEDEPFSSYGMHWIEEKLSVTKKKGFICLEDGCPLCEIGDRPRAMYGFNIFVYTTDDEGRNAKAKGKHMILTCGNRLFDQLKDIHFSKREGPLTDYWRVFKRTGKGGSTGYNVETIRDDDLDDVLEEMDIADLISDEELEEIDLYDETVITNQMWSPSRLDEVAAELS